MFGQVTFGRYLSPCCLTRVWQHIVVEIRYQVTLKIVVRDVN